MAWVEKTPSNRFTGRILLDGRKRSVGTFDTEKEALAAAEAIESGTSTINVALMTLGDYFKVWIEQGHVGPKTKVDYTLIFNKHLGTLARMRVRQITTRDVRAVLKTIDSPDQAHRARAAVGSVYRTLIEDDVVTDNPTHGIRLPRIDRVPRRSLTPEDFKAIALHLPTDGLALFAKVLVGSGMRYGEAAALTGEDFDPSTGEITVSKSLVQTEQGYRISKSTKTHTSRVVPLSATLAADVNDWAREGLMFSVERCLHTPPKLGGPWEVYRHGTWESFVFGCRCTLCVQAQRYKVRRGSGPMTHKMWRQVWTAAAQQAGMSWLPKTHDLRHAHATVLVASGIDIYEVQRRLGHSSITTTQIYLHRVAATMSKAAEASDVFL